MRDQSFQVKAEEPLGTDSHRTISKNSSGCRLLIGHKKCFVLLCPIGEHISWVLFVCSYTTAIVSITACLAHAPKKCTQSGNFQFDIKSPSDFKILSARKLKALFQKYKLQVTTGIRPCIGHVLRKYIYRELFKKIPRRKRRMEKWIHIFSVSILIIPTRLLCQMQANSSGAEFLSTICKFMKRMNFVIACLRPSQNMKLGIFTGSRAVNGKEMYKKAWCTCKVVVLPCQAIAYLTFSSPPHLKLPIIYDTLWSVKNRIFSGKIKLPLLIASQTFLRFWSGK